MTTIASAWKKIVRRHPYALPAIMLTLWLIQLLYWAAWEWRHESIKKTPPLHHAIAQETLIHVEPPILVDDQHGIPASPFTMQFPIDNISDFDSEFGHADEQDTGTISPIVESPKETENETPAAPPPTPAEILSTLRYSGFIQTTRGIRIAFIEDEKTKRMLRLQVGESVEDWELAAITRESIIFTTLNESAVEILRDFREPEPPTPPSPPEPAKPKVEKPKSEPKAETENPGAAPEEETPAP